MKAPSLFDVHQLDECVYQTLDERSKATLLYFMENGHQQGVLVRFKHLKSGWLLHGPMYLIEKPLETGTYLVLVSFSSDARMKLLNEREKFIKAESIKHHEKITLDIKEESKKRLKPTIFTSVALFCFCILILSFYAALIGSGFQFSAVVDRIYSSGVTGLCIIASVVWGGIYYASGLLPIGAKNHITEHLGLLGRSMFKEVKVHD